MMSYSQSAVPIAHAKLGDFFKRAMFILEIMQPTLSLFSNFTLNSIDSYIFRIHLHRFQVQIQPVMLDHSITEHLPQDVATELLQSGVDEQLEMRFIFLIGRYALRKDIGLVGFS